MAQEVTLCKRRPLISTLTLMLPNLEVITLSDLPPQSHIYLATITDEIARNAVARCLHPLSNLRTIYANHSDDDEGLPAQSLAPFIALTSLERLVCHHLETDGSIEYQWPSIDWLERCVLR